MTALTVTLTRWRIEWLVVQWRFKQRRESVKLEMQQKRFQRDYARLTDLLTPQEFLEYATNLRTIERLRTQQGQHLEMFVHLFRTQRYSGDLQQLEATLRQLVAIGTTVKP